MRDIRLTMSGWIGHGGRTRLRAAYGALFILVLLAALFPGLIGEASA